ncbi:MliC family protein [Rubellimicrobium roseum]|uniref:C-type lysozyme inhibitor domain-containing protein n=1 Tax=Rubellimicrobium roseum TaxID=687525 RepID=A0A5C4NJV6_9RHOB|nr:MliC family protein [Rubellimicrobium roseum]TNC73396.1 hypothetical protein FHG71_06025 [Rubellimicrobium roseum]
MCRPLVALAAAACLTACGSSAPIAGLPTGLAAPTPSEVAGVGLPPRGDALTYLCADGTVVQADYPDRDDVDRLGNTARLRINGENVRMIPAVSASGARYIGGGLQWWTRGLTIASLAPLGPGESLASAPGTECRASG